ncbi:MAG: DNA polymerase IV [Ignavibacteriales bacterium]|nr:DNA polymerase IV [Ignavibacteriales bacterium]
MRTATIFHLDLDAFFVSVERLLDPSLEDKPVIVGGNPLGRGVVAACSYEAREFGLHSAMPIRKAYRLCPHGVYVRGHGEEYVRYSRLVRGVMEEFAPVVEQASIDEFYMDFTGCEKMYGSFLELATRLQREVWRRFSLPCSVGVAGNKTVAKICSDFNKPRGVTYAPPGTERLFLERLPLEDMPGVGKKFLPELRRRGFFRVGDVARSSVEYFAAAFGKAGVDLWEKANGEGSTALTVERERKSVSKEHTFGEDVADRETLEETLFGETAKVCRKLRDKRLRASGVTLKLRYADFKTITRSTKIPPTADDREIFETARALLRKAYDRRVAIRLIGVGTTGLAPDTGQAELFETERERRRRLLEAIDEVRGKYGFEAIDLGRYESRRERR